MNSVYYDSLPVASASILAVTKATQSDVPYARPLIPGGGKQKGTNKDQKRLKMDQIMDKKNAPKNRSKYEAKIIKKQKKQKRTPKFECFAVFLTILTHFCCVSRTLLLLKM